MNISAKRPKQALGRINRRDRINGTIDFRFKEGVSDSPQQVIMTEYAGDVSAISKFAEQDSKSGW